MRYNGAEGVRFVNVHGPTELAVAASDEDEAVGAFPAGYAGHCFDRVVHHVDDLGVLPSYFRYVEKSLRPHVHSWGKVPWNPQSRKEGNGILVRSS